DGIRDLIVTGVQTCALPIYVVPLLDLGATYIEGEVPRDLAAAAAEQRHHMLEAVAEYDDELLHLYLEGKESGSDMIRRAIRKGKIGRASCRERGEVQGAEAG